MYVSGYVQRGVREAGADAHVAAVKECGCTSSCVSDCNVVNVVIRAAARTAVQVPCKGMATRTYSIGSKCPAKWIIGVKFIDTVNVESNFISCVANSLIPE